MARKINKLLCVACGICEEICLVVCISPTPDGQRFINEKACVDCGACELACPIKCIEHSL